MDCVWKALMALRLPGNPVMMDTGLSAVAAAP